jgi:hypothetical protein
VERKKYYLEFLRNLTPQVFLFYFAFILGNNLDFSTLDFSNWLPTLTFYVLLFSGFIAIYCNSMLLMKGFYSNFVRLVNKSTLKAKKDNKKRFFFYIVILKRKWFVVFEGFLVFFYLQIILAVVIVSAIISARNVIS